LAVISFSVFPRYIEGISTLIIAKLNSELMIGELKEKLKNIGNVIES